MYLCNKLNMSQFIREVDYGQAWEEFELDEARILHAHEKAKSEKKYDHTEAWETAQAWIMYRVESFQNQQ